MSKQLDAKAGLGFQWSDAICERWKFGGGGGNRPSWPANVLAGALAFAGSWLLPLEFPAYPASVPDADSVHDQRQSKLKRHPKELDGVLILVEAAGIEPASASPLQAVLHT